MLLIREHLKNLAVLAPTRLLETVSNYAVLRTGRETLLPREVLSGVLKSTYFEAVSERIGADTPVLYLEFGVWEGYSLGEWRRMNTCPESRFVGFDSFVGLPDRWRGRPAGYFSTSGKLPAIDDPRVSFEAGWFNETLPDWLRTCGPVPGLAPIVHVDCDLYASALYVLTLLHDVFPWYHVLFDDFSAGEARALRDYMSAYGATFEPMLGRSRTSYARVPGQVFGRLVTTPDRSAAPDPPVRSHPDSSEQPEGAACS